MKFTLIESDLEKRAAEWESCKYYAVEFDYSGDKPEPFCWHEVQRKDGAAK